MNTKYIALILIILAFAACKKTSVTPNNPITPVTPAVKMDTDVYVVGDSKTTKNNGYAALWINDLYTPIADTIKYSSANDVIINGNDVYAMK